MQSPHAAAEVFCATSYRTLVVEGFWLPGYPYGSRCTAPGGWGGSGSPDP